jgi:hypothetical protein
MRWNASAFTHRWNRLNTEFHLPNSGGRSRHGQPVRAIQSTASKNSRGSGPVMVDGWQTLHEPIEPMILDLAT